MKELMKRGFTIALHIVQGTATSLNSSILFGEPIFNSSLTVL
jgi:hypothetical protein